MEIFRGIELRLDRCNNRLGDLVLHSEHVGEIAVKALGPDMAAGDDVNELRANANAIAVLAYTAFDHVADPEFFADLLEMDAFAFVCEGRIASDDEKPAQLRQRGNNV